MSDSKTRSKKIGFSTGALERGDYRSAVTWLWKHHFDSVELSALRLPELRPLLRDLNNLPVSHFTYVSFHAPSSFEAVDEWHVVKELEQVYKRGWNIIVHPDMIRKPALWRRFGKQLLLENMDRRKPVGRTADELEFLFSALPDARLCLDVAHARQLDTTLTVLTDIVRRFAKRIAEVHISELDSGCKHQPMSWCAVSDYQTLSWNSLSAGVPVIIESMLNGQRATLRNDEYSLTCDATHRSLSRKRTVPTVRRGIKRNGYTT
jgi:hypothetical protein